MLKEPLGNPAHQQLQGTIYVLLNSALLQTNGTGEQCWSVTSTNRVTPDACHT
jgi:hypothetical protein